MAAGSGGGVGQRRGREEMEATASGEDPLSLELTDESFLEDLEEETAEERVGPDGEMQARINETVAALRTAYINEKAAPEILPFQTDLVAQLKEMIASQEESLEVQSRTARNVYLRALYETDVDRVRYLVASYLRCRLYKLREWSVHAWTSSEIRENRLSKEEEVFLRDLVEVQVTHWNDSGLAALPEAYDTHSILKDPAVKKGPDLDQFVLAVANDDVDLVVPTPEVTEGGSTIIRQEPIDLSPGDVILIRYSAIREHLIYSRKIDLM